MSAETRPQRVRKPSKQQRRADGLLSSVSESSDSSPEGEPAPSTSTQPEPDTTPSTPQPPALDRSQSTASLASQVTAAVGSSRTDDEKRAKFDECYQTATLSDEEVLRKFPSFLGPQFIFFLTLLKRGRWPSGRLTFTNTSKFPPPSQSRKALSCMSTHALHKYFSSVRWEY